MNLSWKREKGHMVCRWCGGKGHTPYNQPWMQVAENVDPRASAPKFLDFTCVSLLAGRRWFDPNGRNL
jgi:hypothetical protein